MQDDAPVLVSNQDLLNRYDFAKDIVRSLLKTHENGQQSITIGLNGEWGSGKTSLLQFIKTEIILQTAKNPGQNVIIDFNPWRISSEEKLVKEFLDNLSEVIKNYKLAYWNIASKISQLISLADGINNFNPEPISNTAIKSLSVINDLLKKKKSLDQRKVSIDNHLEKKQIRLFVFIDDIDRCTPIQISHLFQLIKLNTSFANTYFFAAYDKAVVTNALYQQYGKFGEKYLEKIVQVDYVVPYASQLVLKNQFLETILKISNEYDLRVSEPELLRCWNQELKKHYTTLRKIYRLCNALKLRVVSVSDDINLIDFILFETIRIEDQNAYDWISKHKNDLVISSEVSPLFPMGVIEKEAVELKEVIREDPDLEIGSNEIKNLIYYLFEGQHTDQGPLFQEKEIDVRQLERDKRISAERFFEHYYCLLVPESNFSVKQVRQFINSVFPDKVEELNLIRSDDRLSDFLRSLGYESSATSPEKQKEIAIALLNYSDSINSEFIENEIADNTFISLTNTVIGIFSVLSKNSNQEEILNILLEDSGIGYSRQYILDQLKNRFEQGIVDSNNEYLKQDFLDDNKERILRGLNNRIKKLAEDCISRPNYYPDGAFKAILVSFHKVYPDEYEMAIQKLIEEPKSFIKLVRASFTRLTRGLNKVEGYNIMSEHLLPNTDQRILSEAMARIEKSGLSSEELKYVELFTVIEKSKYNRDVFYGLDLKPVKY